MKSKLEALKAENFKAISPESAKKILGGDAPAGTAAGCVETNLGSLHYTSDSGGTPNTFYGTSYGAKCTE